MHIGEQRGSSVHQNALADFIHCANDKEKHQQDNEAFSDNLYSSAHLSFAESLLPLDTTTLV
jgi:hypothetical protein